MWGGGKEEGIGIFYFFFWHGGGVVGLGGHEGDENDWSIVKHKKRDCFGGF